jgi:UDP-N-acetylglucosamine 2-epimerase
VKKAWNQYDKTITQMAYGRRGPEGYYEGHVHKKKIHCFEPLGYLDFINLMAHAKIVLTDSGGIQEETTSPFINFNVVPILIF